MSTSNNESLSRCESAEETTVRKKNDSINFNFECPICMYWLNEPVLTTCGHRFCRKCITSWLQNPNPSCPVDNQPLADTDLFPDNFTRREIQQMRLPCPNAPLGCQTLSAPLDIDAHVKICAHAQRQNSDASTASTMQVCSFKMCGCTFVTNDELELVKHLVDEADGHLNLLMKSTHQTAAATTMAQPSPSTNVVRPAPPHAWDAPEKPSPSNNGLAAACSSSASAAPTTLSSGEVASSNNNETTTSASTSSTTSVSQLLNVLYERIVRLEQQSHEKDAQIERLSQAIARLSPSPTIPTSPPPDIDPRYSGGVLVWRIADFPGKIAAMRSDPNTMFYSGEAYTSPYGYRYCVRLNCSPKAQSPDSFGLHVHLMRSDNDQHLEWPFRGRIKIGLVHPVASERSKMDVIMSNPEVLAFHRPVQEISHRGFGFLEYASVTQVRAEGFVTVADGVLTAKVQVTIV